MFTETFLPPSAGWVQSGNIATARRDQAEVLDNFIPTAQGARLRGGISEFADLSAAAVRLFTYVSGGTETLFGSTASAIFDASDVGSGAVRSSLSNGDWSTVQITTSGGQFLVGVNSADTGWTYNGSFSDISLTGVASTALSQVWLFKRRLLFVEQGTTSIWYLGVDSIGGALTEFDLGPHMSKGGSVLFGATWSLDSGDGLDDKCVFVTDQGEVIVYEGNDPSQASTWALVGVYEVGKPLNKHAHFRAGGDLVLLTEDGAVSVASAIQKDRAALSQDAITYPIEDAWRGAIGNRTVSYPISATHWQSGAILLIGTPQTVGGKRVSFVANSQTGAWGRITGWDVRCSAVFGDDLYFGTNDGKIFKADTGATDDGAAYTGVYVPKFAPAGQILDVNAVSVTYRAPKELTFDLDAHADYSVDEILPPQTTMTESGDVWGTGVWGTFVWGSDADTNTFNTWQAAYASGYSVAPSLAITVNQTSALPFEVLTSRVMGEVGAPI